MAEVRSDSKQRTAPAIQLSKNKKLVEALA